MKYLSGYIKSLTDTLDLLDLSQVDQVIRLLSETREAGNQIFLCGNGGSASTASHMANDLGKGASVGSEKRFKAISLTDNTSWMTALSNDISYESVFAEQLKNFGQLGDVLIAISGSGNSQNVINAVRAAQERHMKTIGFIGFGGGKLASIVDVPIVVESNHMGRVEDMHVILMHLICYYFMDQ